jgi:mitochondrial fission protein ELM1
MDNKCINTSDRFNIADTFSRWIAFSGTRSGCPLKSRKEVYPLINLPNYDVILKGDQPISKQEFNYWHRKSSELIKQKEPRLPIGWTTKLINLYLKSMVYVGQFGRPNLVQFIHPPIDKGLWDGIMERYSDDDEIISKTHSKTKIKDIENYEDYRLIIDGIELITNKENWLLLEVEQLWKGTEF